LLRIRQGKGDRSVIELHCNASRLHELTWACRNADSPKTLVSSGGEEAVRGAGAGAAVGVGADAGAGAGAGAGAEAEAGAAGSTTIRHTLPLSTGAHLIHHTRFAIHHTLPPLHQ
jgi:hypothetical protein